MNNSSPDPDKTRLNRPSDTCPTVVPDGGHYTVTHDGTAYWVVYLVAYDDEADLEIDWNGPNPTVTNHDVVETHDTVCLLTRESVVEHGLESEMLAHGDAMWCTEFADLEPGEELRLAALGGEA